MTRRRATAATVAAATASAATPLEPPPELARLRRMAIVVGVIGGAASVAGAIADPPTFFQSYLVEFLYWLGLTYGCLGLVMLHHLTGGAWGLVIRRVLEAASRTLPLMVLLFLPLLFGLHYIYPWARPGWGAGDPADAHKVAYLNVPAFVLRAALYFAVLGALVWFLGRSSDEQDRTGNPTLERRMRLLSAPGLGLYCIVATFASIDWLMSLDPHWSSSIYGVSFVGGQALEAMGFVIVAGFFLAGRPPMAGVISKRHFHDQGNLLLAFLMLWAYFAVSQLIIIWSGNLPEEIPFYLHRLGPGWQGMSLVLLLGHFVLPFMFLLSRRVKGDPRLLAGVAGFLLLMRWVDLAWQAQPAFHPEGPKWSWIDLALPVAMGGAWVAVFSWQLATRPLLPVHDPHLEEMLAHD